MGKERNRAHPSTMDSHTNSTTSHAKANRQTTSVVTAVMVFDTYELVANILLRLPITTLLLVGRVNTSFQAVITRSKTIQQALFLQADTSTIRPKTEPAINWRALERSKPQHGP